MSRLVFVVQSPPPAHVAQGAGQSVATQTLSGAGFCALGETSGGSDSTSDGTERAHDAWSVNVIAAIARIRAARNKAFMGRYARSPVQDARRRTHARCRGWFYTSWTVPLGR